MQVRSLGREDLLEEGMAIHSGILAWRIPTDRGAWWATVHGVTKIKTRLSDQHTHKENINKALLQALQICPFSPAAPSSGFRS